MIRPYYFKGDYLEVLDQRKLPFKEEYLKVKDEEEGARCIKEMVIRGAPAIGCFASFCFYLGVLRGREPERVYRTLINTRPTAINLKNSLDRMMRAYKEGRELLREAQRIEEEEIQRSERMAEVGAKLLPDRVRVLTHCNTGSLATLGLGTALGVIKKAKEMGKEVFVFVDETRPYLQGSRLTAWELEREGIEHRIIVDSLAGYLMAKGEVDVVIVGADRITPDYRVANKVGTYSLSVLAKFHKIPFYVVAPRSTFTREREIPLEERQEGEVKSCFGKEVAPKSSRAYNLSFDITPPSNITAIITEDGIIKTG